MSDTLRQTFPADVLTAPAAPTPTGERPGWRGVISAACCAATLVLGACSTPASHHEPDQSDRGTSSRSSPGLNVSPELNKLPDYDNILAGELPDTLMTFTGMPGTEAEADDMAPDMARKLKEFMRAGVKPLVIMEPQINGWTDNAGTAKIAAGKKYDKALERYFTNLQNEGIDADTAGLWIFMPEANTPAWDGDTAPDDVSRAIVHSARSFKKIFPQGQAGILLDSKTYESNDTDWATGRFKSLAPYAKDIPRGLIDSVGLQGFPWAPEGGSGADMGSPEDIVNHRLADELAKRLGATSVWFNTGTFQRIHTDGSPATATPNQRADFLRGVLQEVQDAKNEGLDPTVLIFAQDKSDTNEATDWHYPPGKNAQVLKAFIESARKSGVNVGLYDATQ